MQNCGQLQASIAVALIAQSAEELWPKDMQSRAPIAQNTTLRIGVLLSSGLCSKKCAQAMPFELRWRRKQSTWKISLSQPTLAGYCHCRVRCFVTHVRRRTTTVFEKNLLAGKRILVTGGATGLGKRLGKRFLELGASLYICGRREEGLGEAADELRKATGGTVTTFSGGGRDSEVVGVTSQRCC